MRARNLGLLLATVGLLAACGSGSTESAVAARRSAAHKAVSPADAQARNMVNAVADAKGGDPVPVQVKFQLKSRPDVAQPLDVDIVIVPVSGSVDRIVGTVEGEEGLDIVDGGQIPAADRPPEGVSIAHTIRVLPKRDGIFTLSAVLTVDSAGQSSRETYSIPIIAGAGMPDLPTKPSTPAAPAGSPGSAAKPSAPT
ncbi:MAG TPA: hypothetical protein VEY89_05910, partial [Candidatus Dormibacteraeota bacterium]|nr:hypothetical protein [Candidatus Dormibacteraeota bacterium]